MRVTEKIREGVVVGKSKGIHGEGKGGETRRCDTRQDSEENGKGERVAREKAERTHQHVQPGLWSTFLLDMMMHAAWICDQIGEMNRVWWWWAGLKQGVHPRQETRGMYRAAKKGNEGRPAEMPSR